MNITEGLMTGTALFKKPVYKASLTGSLLTVLCAEGTKDHVQILTQFPTPAFPPWWLSNPEVADVIKDTVPVRHKVFNSDELDFLIKYDELGKLSLDTLVYLADEYDRCTFEIEQELFIPLFNQLPKLVEEYKYNSNIYNVESNTRDLPQNCIIGISFYKLHTFLYDVYGNKPDGLGIAFEFLDKRNSGNLPRVSIGYYILLTNVYEGVFYMDGKERYALRSTRFRDKSDYLRSMLELAKLEKRPEKSINLNDYEYKSANYNPFEDKKDLPKDNGWDQAVKSVKREPMWASSPRRYKDKYPEAVGEIAKCPPAEPEEYIEPPKKLKTLRTTRTRDYSKLMEDNKELDKLLARSKAKKIGHGEKMDHYQKMYGGSTKRYHTTSSDSTSNSSDQVRSLKSMAEKFSETIASSIEESRMAETFRELKVDYERGSIPLEYATTVHKSMEMLASEIPGIVIPGDLPVDIAVPKPVESVSSSTQTESVPEEDNLDYGFLLDDDYSINDK